MLVIDSEEKQQKMMKTSANKNIFLKNYQCRIQSFLGHTSIYSYCVLKSN